MSSALANYITAGSYLLIHSALLTKINYRLSWGRPRFKGHWTSIKDFEFLGLWNFSSFFDLHVPQHLENLTETILFHSCNIILVFSTIIVLPTHHYIFCRFHSAEWCTGTSNLFLPEVISLSGLDLRMAPLLTSLSMPKLLLFLGCQWLFDTLVPDVLSDFNALVLLVCILKNLVCWHSYLPFSLQGRK